jgi:hypothetical protein
MVDYKMKGQVNQVFTIIFSSIIIVTLILLSVSGIKLLYENKCDAENIDFRTDLSDSLNNYKTYGALQKHSISAPCNAQVLCLIDSETSYIFDESRNVLPANFPLPLAGAIEAFHDGNKYSKNVFIYDNQFIYDLDYIEGIKIDDDNKIVCIQRKNGNFEFYSLGKGNGVEIYSENNIVQNAILMSFLNPYESYLTGSDTEVTVYVDGNRIPAGLNIDEIQKLASKQIENIAVTRIGPDEDGNLIYSVTGNTFRNLFGIFPLPVGIQQQIKSDGEITDTTKSWWSVFTRKY